MTEPTTQVNAEGTAVKVVQVASNTEQIAAAGVGLMTAGPLGAVAAWGMIRGLQGKWVPWTIVGFVAAPLLGIFQLTSLSFAFAFLDGFNQGYQESLQESRQERLYER